MKWQLGIVHLAPDSVVTTHAALSEPLTIGLMSEPIFINQDSRSLTRADISVLSYYFAAPLN